MACIPRTRMDPLIAQAPGHENRIFCLMHEGKTLWVKRGSKNYLNRFQQCMGMLVSGPLQRLGPARTRLYREVTRIRALRRTGAFVPEVVTVGADYIVLSDIGESLETLLRRTPTPAEATAYVTGSAHVLAQLHRSRQWHGNAKLRNFTYHAASGRTGMIDFEDPVSPLPLVYKHIKDIFMLAGSSYRFDPSGQLLRTILATYRREHSLVPALIAALLLLPLYCLLKPLQSVMGRDVQELLATLHGLYALV